ncbi:hypothetical protein Q4502_01345 [Mesomycoplasma ovipneumoniae]|nr:hypothetical protein [Mesomycoplasma ovipneumoniae]MDO6856350.1 hypothetical protein [Mesomycoplasma ovipneumoniae]
MLILTDSKRVVIEKIQIYSWDKITHSKIAEFKTFKSKSLHFTEEFRANL